jgi:Icc-related predicted phosphoesterase
MIKIWHISDTHGRHDSLEVPQEVDLVIFSGDCSNSSDSAVNVNQVKSFIDWFTELPIREKIFVAGNHDVSIERKLVEPSDLLSRDIVYLENDSTVIGGLKIWGSPYTPCFGHNWSWNMARNKLNRVWGLIPDDVDVIITHGPPKGILDLSYDESSRLEYCGCSSLKKRIFKLNPKLCCFGHIHNNRECMNSGLKILPNIDTIFSNGSVTSDDGEKVSNGNLVSIMGK